MKTKKKLTFRKLLPILLLTVFCVSATAALIPRVPRAPQSVESVAELEAYLQDLTAAGNPPSLSLVVVKDGRTVYSRSFGLADGPAGIAATEDTVYHWWSTTKMFTATAVFQLADAGLLNLDDPVVDYLPYFKVEYPSPDSAPVTIRHLLNHSSGLPDNVPAVVGWMHFEGEADFDQTALLKQVLPDYSKLLFEPGSQSRYTNVGYMVLGAVIEAVSGETYEDFVRAYILQPLGMQHTDFVYTDAMHANAAAGMHPLLDIQSAFLPFFYHGRLRDLVREVKDGQMWTNRLLADSNPPTGLIGPADDLARFVTAHLNGGELAGQRVLSQASVEQMMLDSYVPTSGGQVDTSLQGLGWEICGQGTDLCLEHGGGGPGFGSAIRLYPERSLGIVVTANSTNIDRDGLLDLVAGMDW